MAPSSEQCQYKQLFVRIEGVAPIPTTKRYQKYRHLANATLGGHMEDIDGARLHAADRNHLLDQCFVVYRTYNEDIQFRALGCRARCLSIPFGDILIKVCQKICRSWSSCRRIPFRSFDGPTLLLRKKTRIAIVRTPTNDQYPSHE